jgi:hypothetical protein
MKIRVLTLALPVLALGLACSTSKSSKTASTAGTPEAGAATASSASTSTSAHAADQIVAGRVVEVSGQSLTIDSSQSGGPPTMLLMIVPETKFTVDGHAAQASDLTPGQDVRASYNQTGGRPTAVKIEAGQGMSSAPAGTPGAPAGTQPSTGSTNEAGQSGTTGAQSPGSPSGATPDTSGQQPGKY